jgi:hypothetical protein
MRTVDVTLQTIKRLFVIEADASILVLASLHSWNVKGRMTTNLEVYLTGVGVVDMPDYSDLVGIEYITDTEGEIIGIDLFCLFRRLEGESHLALTLSNEFEIRITGKSVTRQMILFPLHTVSVIVDAAHYGEKDG